MIKFCRGLSGGSQKWPRPWCLKPPPWTCGAFVTDARARIHSRHIDAAPVSSCPISCRACVDQSERQMSQRHDAARGGLGWTIPFQYLIDRLNGDLQGDTAIPLEDDSRHSSLSARCITCCHAATRSCYCFPVYGLCVFSVFFSLLFFCSDWSSLVQEFLRLCSWSEFYRFPWAFPRISLALRRFVRISQNFVNFLGFAVVKLA